MSPPPTPAPVPQQVTLGIQTRERTVLPPARSKVQGQAAWKICSAEMSDCGKFPGTGLLRGEGGGVRAAGAGRPIAARSLA